MTLLEKAMTEDELLTAATEALTLFRWRWMHLRRSDKALVMGHQGFPDIIAIRPPTVMFLELKSAKGNLTLPQHEWWQAIKACPDVDYFLLRPDTLDTFLAMIR